MNQIDNETVEDIKKCDFIDVGTGPGKITLYKEQTVVQKNIPEAEAVNALVDLIKSHGEWVEKN